MNLETFNAPDWLATEGGRLTSRANHYHHVGFVNTCPAFKISSSSSRAQAAGWFSEKRSLGQAVLWAGNALPGFDVRSQSGRILVP